MTIESRPDRASDDDEPFQDRYTSATADLSAGGIATAGITPPPAVGMPAPTTEAVETLEELDEPVAEHVIQPVTSPEGRSAGALVPLRQEAMRGSLAAADAEERSLVSGGPIAGVGVGTLVVVGAASGAWFYYRWQQERNKPINRLRRRARGLAKEVAQVRDGDLAIPAGASSLLVASVLLGRALLSRRGSEEQADAPDDEESGATLDLDQIRSRWSRLPGPSTDTTRALADSSVALLGAARDRVGSAPRPPAPFGVGLGGLALAAAVGYVVWRVVNRRADGPETWHMDVPAGS